MTIQTKICGITSLEAADAAARAGTDFGGLAFFAHSPRHVSLEQARALGARLHGRCRVVALTVDAADSEIAAAVEACRPDLLQLHGRESPERVAAIRQHFGLPVIKAIAIAEAADLAALPAYEAVADMLLLDAKAPPAADRPGGHGAAFDWQLLRGRRFTRPWLLAGGLTPENVGRAIRVCDAPGVDCSSGVETTPGAKDPALIAAFVSAARAARLAGALA